jgi:hypothetical protein
LDVENADLAVENADLAVLTRLPNHDISTACGEISEISHFSGLKIEESRIRGIEQAAFAIPE